MSEETKTEQSEELKCGLVMPISAIDGYREHHWKDVEEILCDAIKSVGFNPRMVSDADDVRIIQKSIVQNLYENPIVVCDVSGKNPNVMFELGLRLAFDKPIVIVKDYETQFSFDTSIIEHIEYPRDLRFSEIKEFKEKLAKKVKATYESSVKDPSYSTFLKHFRMLTVAKLDTEEVSKEDYIIEELREIKKTIAMQQKTGISHLNIPAFSPDSKGVVIDGSDLPLPYIYNSINSPSDFLVRDFRCLTPTIVRSKTAENQDKSGSEED